MAEDTGGALVGLARRQGISEMLHRTASRVPGKLAIVGGETRLTFAELEAAVSRTAAALAAEGLNKGDRLALLSHNCWQFAVLSFATARLGVILVPVNFMLGPAEIAYILGHSQAAAFVAEDGLAATAAQAIEEAGLDVPARAVIRLREGEVPAGWADLQHWIDRGGTPPQVDVGDDDLVRLMYTSGTESRPKGAMLSSRSLMWQYVSCVVDGGMAGDDIEVHRGGHLPDARGGRSRRLRRAPPAVGRSSRRRCRPQARRLAHRRSRDHAHARPAGRVQDPQARRHRRRRAEKPQRQDPQTATPPRAQQPRRTGVMPARPGPTQTRGPSCRR